MMGLNDTYECEKYSFLKNRFPKTYRDAERFKSIGLVYVVVLMLVFILSHFFYSSILEFLIRIMMGWSLLNIIFVGVMIAVLDIQVKALTEEEMSERKPPLRYKASMVWGCCLCISGIVALHLSAQYKKDYIFKCSYFYLEDITGVYHIWDDCHYIGLDKNDKPIRNVNCFWVKGHELEDWHTLCVACKEVAEDAADDYGY